MANHANANPVQHARSVVSAAFARGTVPAPYYLHLLMHAQALRMPVAVSTGCAGSAGGSTRVQRFTAQHKGPTATRSAWVWRKVRVMRTVQGKQVMREFWVQTYSRVTVVP